MEKITAKNRKEELAEIIRNRIIRYSIIPAITRDEGSPLNPPKYYVFGEMAKPGGIFIVILSEAKDLSFCSRRSPDRTRKMPA